MNHVYLMGRAVSDPDIRETSNGNSMARFTMALDKRLSKAQKEAFQREGKQTADFIRVIAWNGLAKTAGRFLRKGARLCVCGSISSGSFEGNDGERHYFTDVIADELRMIDMPESDDRDREDSYDLESHENEAQKS